MIVMGRTSVVAGEETGVRCAQLWWKQPHRTGQAEEQRWGVELVGGGGARHLEVGLDKAWGRVMQSRGRGYAEQGAGLYKVAGQDLVL